MFRRIEARGYRCLRAVEQEINPFDILVGSNASGKSSFLDVLPFLGTLVSAGLEAAVEERTANFHDLVWGRDADHFELAVEARIPNDRRSYPPAPPVGFEARDTIRYEVGVRLDTATEKLHIANERVTLHRSHRPPSEPGIEIVARSHVFRFYTESAQQSFEQELPHRNYTALDRIPMDREFPATAWLRECLRGGIQRVALDVEALRRPSPPAASGVSEPGGSYLARSVSQLKSRNPGEFRAWLAHVRTVLGDIQDIRSVLKEDDRHRYIMIDYENGVSVPSWMVSDGTLRLLALTLLAYIPGFSGAYLIEEPENGVHPAALQAIFESLSSVYDGQVLVASHSPVLLSMAKADQLLCFVKTSDGARIVRGSEHQALRDWQGEVSLGLLAASGILG